MPSRCSLRFSPRLDRGDPDLLALLPFLASALAAPVVDAPVETVVVEGPGPAPDPGLVSSALTVVRVADLPGSADLGAAVEGAAGVFVQRLGGLGDWSTVSIRGASSRQVLVAIDGIPLNPDGSSVVDLSEIAIRSFERVEVYRGGGPPDLAAAAMGGVVNLVPGDEGAPPALSVTLGSHRTGRLHGDGAFATPMVGGFLAVDAFTTSGAFRYFDDQRTPYNLTDDRLRLRDNNGAHQVSALGRLRVGDGPVRFTVIDSFLWRTEGVPGPISAPTAEVRYGVLENLAAGQVDGAVGSTSLEGRLWGRLREERFDDRASEIGLLAQWTRDRTATVGTRAHLGHAAGPVVLGLTADGRLDHYVSHDRVADVFTPARLRWSGTLAASADWRVGDALLVQPVVQGQGLWSRDRAADSARVATLAFTPRLGVLVRPVPEVAIKANGGRYLRPPDFLELFGDRGAFAGRPDLLPERGWQADLGVRYALPDEGSVHGSVEAGGFGLWSRDAIAYVQNGQRVVVPVNIGRSRVLGVESALSITLFDRVDLDTSLTYTASANLSGDAAYAGKQLPRIPAWEAWHRVGVRPHDVLGLAYTFSYTSGEYWDATNWFRAAPRPLHGASVRVEPTPGLSFEFEALNLADTIAEVVPRDPFEPADPGRVVAPVTDFSGYPLPGRTFLATVRWEPARRHP